MVVATRRMKQLRIVSKTKEAYISIYDITRHPLVNSMVYCQDGKKKSYALGTYRVFLRGLVDQRKSTPTA